MARGLAPRRTDHDRQRRGRMYALAVAVLLAFSGRVAAQTAQQAECSAAAEPAERACVWTGDCDVPGCGSLCLANLTRVSAFATLEDAAWRPGWYELCPRLAELVAFFGAAAAAATPARRLQGGDGAPGLGGGHGSSAAAARRLRQAGGDVQLPCPSPEAVQAVAPIMQSQAQGWQAALAAAEAGQALTEEQQALGFILDSPHQFRVLSTYLVDPAALLAYAAANCTQALIPPERAAAYVRYLPSEEERARVSAGAPLSACRDNDGAAERHFARLQSVVPACTFPYAEGGAAYCFPNRLAYALYTPDNTGCATAVAEAYGLPPSPLTAAAQHVDAIQAACSAAATQEDCGVVDTTTAEAELAAAYNSYAYAAPLGADPPPPALPPPAAVEPLPGPAEVAAPAAAGAGPVDTSGRDAGATPQQEFCSEDVQQIEQGVCEWTGSCTVPGCAGRCQGRLLAASAFFALEDAAWSQEWWEVCPRLARIVRFQLDRMAGTAPAPPPPAGGAGSRRSLLDAALPGASRTLLDTGGGTVLRGAMCPTPEELARVAPAFHNVTRNWETVLRAARDGRAPPPDLRNIEATIRRHPHEFRVLVRVMSTEARLREFFGARCTDGAVAGGARRLLQEFVDVELAPEGVVELCRDSGNATEAFYQRQIEMTRTCLPPFGQRPSCYAAPSTGVAWTPTTAPCGAALAAAYGVQEGPLSDAIPLVRQLDSACQNATAAAACEAVSSTDVLSVLSSTYRSFPYRAPLSDEPAVPEASADAEAEGDYEYEPPAASPTPPPPSQGRVALAGLASDAHSVRRAAACVAVAAASAALAL